MAGAPLSRLIEIANTLFPFSEAEPWDNCGLQVGDPNQHIKLVCFALDAVKETVRFAADRSCQTLFTHHPLIMDPLRCITPANMVGDTILEAVRCGVSIVSLHTNLDAAPGGLNDHLAGMLGIGDVSVPEGASCARLGRLAEPISLSELAAHIGRKLSVSGVRRIGDRERLVRKVFLVSGSGMGYLPQAIENRVDAIVTGDVRYHAAREALEAGLAVIDAGHFGLEKPAIKLMSSAFEAELSKAGSAVRCVECDVETDPFTI